MTRICIDCRRPFLYVNRKSVACPSCRPARINKQKLDSQRKRLQVKRHNEPVDISEEEIELRFAAALREIRSRPVEAEE